MISCSTVILFSPLHRDLYAILYFHDILKYIDFEYLLLASVNSVRHMKVLPWLLRQPLQFMVSSRSYQKARL